MLHTKLKPILENTTNEFYTAKLKPILENKYQSKIKNGLQIGQQSKLKPILENKFVRPMSFISQT